MLEKADLKLAAIYFVLDENPFSKRKVLLWRKLHLAGKE
jgi:hypothetical protein